MEISRQTKIVCHVKNRLRSFNLLTLSVSQRLILKQLPPGSNKAFCSFSAPRITFAYLNLHLAAEWRVLTLLGRTWSNVCSRHPPFSMEWLESAFSSSCFTYLEQRPRLLLFDTTILFTKLPTGLAHYQLNCFETPLKCISGQYCHGHLGKPHGYRWPWFSGGGHYFSVSWEHVFIRVNRC